MIASFRHKGLKKFWETGSLAGIQPSHARRLDVLLTVLHAAVRAGDMDRPGFHLHSLLGTQPTRWAVHINANWRLTFSFYEGNAYWVDYEDYH